MLIDIIIALLNGICISLSRSVNGRLSIEKTAFQASLWNHIVGFLFLTLFLFYQQYDLSRFFYPAPLYAYCGGAMGAGFVAINSYVLPRIGATQTALLVMSGQVVSGEIIDLFISTSPWQGINFLAIVFIFAGVILSKFSTTRKKAQRTSPRQVN